MGFLKIKEDKYGDAFKYLLEALDLIYANQLNSYEAKALLTLAEVHGKLGNHKEAFMASQKGMALNDNLLDRELTNQMSVMKVKQTYVEDLIYKKLYHQINVISQISQKITATFDIEKSGKILSEHIKELLEVDYLTIGLYSEDKKWLEYKYYLQKEDVLSKIKIPLQKEYPANSPCPFNRTGLIVNDLGTHDFPCGTSHCHNMPIPPTSIPFSPVPC